MEQTLPSSTDGQDEEPEAQLVLVGLGSPERDFAHAGAVIPLHGLHCVRFGRATGEIYEQGRKDGVLQLSIPLPWVSGRHAELRLEGPRLRVVDHGSRNGTYVEGEPVQPHAIVSLGQVLEVGRSFWMLRLVRRSTLAIEPSEVLPRLANPEVRHLEQMLARLAPSNVPILITGETGTGKEQLARRLHARSGRTGAFVTVNMAAGSIDRLLHDQGERMVAARGGTLYLDDVGELPLDEQTKLTSTLMSHVPNDWQLEGQGEGELRLVASSARDLRAMVESGAFRPDLMARLAGFEARVPPLRARREDLGLLAREVLTQDVESPPRLTTEVFRSMLVHPWPFNLRELRHSLVAAASLVEAPSEEIDVDVWTRARWTVEGGDPTPTRIEAVRRELVSQLARHRGEVRAVAEALHCEVEDVERWAERFSLRPERYRDTG